MPRYKLQGPDGRTVTIEAADRATALRGAQEWAAANPAPSQPVTPQQQAALDYTRRIAEVSAMAARRPAPPRTRPNETRRERTQREGEAYASRTTGGDVQLALGSGVLRGLGGMADLGGMLSNPALAFSGQPQPSAILDELGWGYTPQTGAGSFAEGAGMMLPNALAPGSALARTAAVAIPTIAGEAARIGTREAGYDEQSQENMRGLAQFAAGLTSGVRLGRPGPPRVKPERLSRQEEAALRRVTRGVKPAEARARVSDIQEYGGQPVLADAIGSRGQVRIRAAATRDIPEQQTAVDFQTGRRVNSQSFASRLGERVSPETRSPAATRAAIEDARNTQASGDYAGPYQTVISVDRSTAATPIHDLPPNVRSVLEDGVGRAAVGRALEAELIEQNEPMIRQLQALANGDRSVPITAEALDRVRIAFREMGNDAASAFKGKASRAFFGRVNQLDTILDAVPELRTARAAFREQSLQADAVDAGDRLFAPRGVREDVEGAAAMTEAQRRAALAGARNAIEERAGKPATAAGALDELATGETVGARLNAYGGPAVAADVQRGARVGRSMLDTARNVSPRIGSESNLNIEGSAALNGVGAVAEAGLAVKTGGLSAMFRPVVEMLKRARMSDADAGRMIQIALDPDPRKLELALQYLEGTSPTLARMVRAELGRIAARGAPVAAIAGSTAASQAQARPSPPR